MKPKPVVARQLATQDVDETIGHYLIEGSDCAALSFIDELEKAYGHIAQHPASGSLRYAHELDIPDLRSWPMRKLPYLVFYVEHVDHIDIWRVLHSQRDIPVWMRESDVS